MKLKPKAEKTRTYEEWWVGNITRRELLRAGGLTLLGTTLPHFPGLPTVKAATNPDFLVGWNHPWAAYGHDCGDNAWGHDGILASGWTYETFSNTQGFTNTQWTTERPCSGRGSLRITADLIGQHLHKSNGEVNLNLENHLPVLCPTGATPALDLEGVTARCRVWLPPGSAGRITPPAAQNGIQLFFKTRLSDQHWPAFYSEWQTFNSIGRDVALRSQPM